MEKTSTFDEILENAFYGFIALFAKYEDALSRPMLFGELIQYKIFLTGNELKALRTL